MTTLIEYETVRAPIFRCPECGHPHMSTFLRPKMHCCADELPNVMRLNRIVQLPCGYRVFQPKEEVH